MLFSFQAACQYPKIVLEQRHCDAFKQHTILCVGEQALRMPLSVGPHYFKGNLRKVTGSSYKLGSRKIGCDE